MSEAGVKGNLLNVTIYHKCKKSAQHNYHIPEKIWDPWAQTYGHRDYIYTIKNSIFTYFVTIWGQKGPQNMAPGAHTLHTFKNRFLLNPVETYACA